MKTLRKLAILLLIVAHHLGAACQDTAQFEKKMFIQGSDTLLYRVLYPLGFQAKKKYPLLLFLHGSGERGNDNAAQLKWGGSLFADSVNRMAYPAIVVFPQCPQQSSWAAMTHTKPTDSLGGFGFPDSLHATVPMTLLVKLMQSFVENGAADSRRIYVGGLSMGGFGCFEILWRMPHFFAAAMPICGGGNPAKVVLYAKNFPIWVFHGDRDPAVPVSNSRLMVGALRTAGARVKYSEYPGVGHDSWKNAFAEPDLLSWLFSQKR